MSGSVNEAVPVLTLRRGEERRLRSGHMWVYSNEVDTDKTPLKGLAPGSEVVIEDNRGKPLGRAYVNPQSLICARLYSRDVTQGLSNSFLKKRVEQAISFRERLFPDGCYRAVFGEADGLPGLVIDRYRDVFVLQSGTAGMERVQEQVAKVLVDQHQARVVVAKNESSIRELEGLEQYTRALHGDLPETVSLTENGVAYSAPLAAGQKTGWFFDHRAARRHIIPLAKDARVLDVFAYCGAWGVLAAAHGARDVMCVDSSALALDFVHRNAEANGVAERVQSLQADAATGMKELASAGEKFDIVVLDPPAFIKRRKDIKNGLAGYHSINELAMRLVAPGGVLVSASCSMHLQSEQLLDVVRASARHIDRFAQVFASAGQAEDHPMHPAIPETAYLKSWFVRVLPSL
ncbi:class I SAM-dependent rRNA methyltransferase [Alcanivorax limicola]|uniref:class I SAM-dependent rRNA methyltransferase n=1 Tax=Alcanivorax limicola TaxID=2874102 RepID=UPI001CBD2B19|nr:class I SAM-dependent rRNA methyltransferase [Alcanivorax limicola]